ncbi:MULTISPECIES: MarR family winged helix-turn-helix transcriptional regulator [unclassified Nocardiopsis]|uniref:MarR family winged helix-turn-helix transcriptional regulator n=1 Tax=unclassified Nocardiopsis TaxID=2649073 RepID=UPI00191585A4|nr:MULTISPECIES: MarR family transcriptional regulator [unclassified Nocardiopsis]
MHETIRAEVISLTTVPADVSDPELSVLVTLYQARQPVRQSELARALRWDRTRLSHLLTRMSRRGYIERIKSSSGVDVAPLPAGIHLIESAAPELEAAVQQHLVDRLGDSDADTLRSFLERLNRTGRAERSGHES